MKQGQLEAIISKKRKRMGRRKVIAKPFCGNGDNVVNG